MYSILITIENGKLKFLTNADGSQYIASSLVAVQEKVKEILRITPLNEITVVKNCTITESIVVTENTANPENEEVEQVESNNEQNQG